LNRVKRKPAANIDPNFMRVSAIFDNYYKSLFYFG